MATAKDNRLTKIQQGVSDTKRLIRRGEYNASMAKARQTLEFMVKLRCERAGLSAAGNLKTMIDSLYRKRRISKSACGHYHTIRMIGNRAVHEGDADARHAKEAYRILSQEVRVFSRSLGRRRAKGAPPAMLRVFLKLLLPILCILFLFWAVKLTAAKNDADTAPEASAAVETVARAAHLHRPRQIPFIMPRQHPDHHHQNRAYDHCKIHVETVVQRHIAHRPRDRRAGIDMLL